MNKTSLKKIIKEELMKELNEEEKILYKFTFKPNFLDDNGNPHMPVYVYLTSSDRMKKSKYAAIYTIGGWGTKDYKTLPSKEKINTMFVEGGDELQKIIKSLTKTKIHEKNEKEISIGTKLEATKNNVMVLDKNMGINKFSEYNVDIFLERFLSGDIRNDEKIYTQLKNKKDVDKLNSAINIYDLKLNENNIIKEGLTRKDIDLIRSIIRQELADIYKTFWIKRNIWK